jgi:maleylpyruvate isomerase
MSDPALLALLEGGTRRLVRTVDAMADGQWTEPSLLPGWSRAHVVAHLTLNAEGLTAALDGVREGRAVPMYASQEARDGDIAELASAPSSDLRDRFLGSTTLIAEAVADLPDNLRAVSIDRVPGGRSFAAGETLTMRVCEVEVHHADLGLDATAADWDPAFAAFLLERRAFLYAGAPFTVHASDLGRTWTFGAAGGPTVSGTGSALAWWTTGRGSGDGLTSDDGQVPRMEAW